MCRILALRSAGPFDVNPWLDAFAERCEASKEFQGHGWGVSWSAGGRWHRYRSIAPIWDDERPHIPPFDVVLVHARSAFRDEGIVVENNMPFVDEDLSFAFNGELRGVRLNVPGETGAAKLLHLFKRFRSSAGGDMGAALQKLERVVSLRSEYVRALNVVVSDGRQVWATNRFGEDPDYFTLHEGQVFGASGVTSVLCSERLSISGVDPGWTMWQNGFTRSLVMEAPCSF